MGRAAMTDADVPLALTREAGVPKTHHLKTWPVHYREILAGRKTFELRLNDRDYRVGDTLVLEEYEPGRTGFFTGHKMRKVVTHMLGAELPHPGLRANFVIMSIQDPT